MDCVAPLLLRGATQSIGDLERILGLLDATLPTRVLVARTYSWYDLALPGTTWYDLVLFFLVLARWCGMRAVCNLLVPPFPRFLFLFPFFFPSLLFYWKGERAIRTSRIQKNGQRGGQYTVPIL